MNNALENVILFINENTTILIAICIFLIVILVIYLIESSVKSSKIEKNKYIDEKRTKELIEKHNIEVKKQQVKNVFDISNVEDEKEENLEETFGNDHSIKDLKVEFEDLEKSKNNNINTDETKIDDNETKQINKSKNSEKSNVNVIYKNENKLSDILFGCIEKQPEGKLDSSVVKKDEEIEELNSAEELDEIMKKLNNYKN